MMSVDMQIAVAHHGQIDLTVACDLVQHMIEESDTCTNIGFTGAVKIHRYQDRCFRRLTLYIGSSRHNEILISFPDRERGT